MKYIFASIVFSFAIFIVIDGKKLADKDDTPNEFAELIWKDMKDMAETVGRHMLTECFQSCISCELCKRFMIQDVTDLKVASKNGLPIYYKIFFSGSR
uniref:Apple domain-containing protein n=1 Tax=Strongyloides venezuelensis TaxID=75913 RepID=A0A0K0FWI8_STRVS